MEAGMVAGDSLQSGTNDNGAGGGATDIALYGTTGNTQWNFSDHFYSRIIVAGGGGAGRGSETSTAAGTESGMRRNSDKWWRLWLWSFSISI